MTELLSRVKDSLKFRLNAVFNSYSEIFFLNNSLIGLAIFAVTLFNPNLSVAGLLSVSAAYLFAKFINMDEAFLNSGFYTYNPLLVGLGIGYLFKVTFLTAFFIVSAAIFTFVLTAMLNSVFSWYLKLPILSLPFVIVTSMAYMAAGRYSNLFVSGLYSFPAGNIDKATPLWLEGFFRSLGAIFFMPYVLPGIILALIILFSSRILFMLATFGYYAGTAASGLMSGSFQQAFSNINHFNYILISMAIGGVFLIPSLKSYVLAFIAVLTSGMLINSVEVLGSAYGVTGFTLPFNIVSLSFVYVLGLVKYPQIAVFIKSTPEETLDYYLSNLKRYQGSHRSIYLPYSGKWTVWQGFDGQWTHKSNWKYAYDFIITDAEGKSFDNQGLNLTDYYSFNKPVLSPVRGRIHKIVDNLPDIPPGRSDQTNNWGNLVVIYDERGFFVEISHLAQNSIKPKPGDWVERGAFLGLCGNSGYSPQPHIHIQVQGTGEPGSHTLPFSFSHYSVNDRFFSNDLPEEGDSPEPVFYEKDLDFKTSFILGDVCNYEILKNGRKIDEVALEVKMADDGTFYFDSGRGRLYFGKYEGMYYAYRVEGDDLCLRNMMIAIPRLPPAFKKDLSWEDHLPLGLFADGFKKHLLQFLSSFYNPVSRITTVLKYKGDGVIEGVAVSETLNIKKTTLAELDKVTGFKRVVSDNIEIRKIQNEENNS